MKLPQLSLRELFLLVVIAAMGCGWWVEHRKRSELLFHHSALSAASFGISQNFYREEGKRKVLEAAISKEGYSIAWGTGSDSVSLTKSP